MIDPLKTAALYIRVSTDKQEELSPSAQQRLLLEYAKKNNLSVIQENIYIENGISGKKADKRPEFQRMIGAAKDHQFDVILLWKFSRFARNQEESIVYKSMLRKKCNVDVISISEPLVDGPFGSLIERIIEWMDEYYSIRLSGEVIRGMTEKALQGGYQSVPPIGYRSVPGSAPVVDPDGAAIVRRIFDSFLSGDTFSGIAKSLNSSGLTTSRGSVWENRTVRYILENPFYIGQVRWNRAKHGSHIANPADQIIVSKGAHEAIISTEQWDAVQHKLQQTLRPYRSRDASSYRHWLSGLLRCPICGAVLTYNAGSKSRAHPSPYFQCYRYTKGQHSGSQAVNARNAEFMFLSSLTNTINNGVGAFSPAAPVSGTSSRIPDFEQSLARLDARAARAKAAYLDGIDSLDEYKKNKTALLDERSRIQSLIDAEQKKQASASCRAFDRDYFASVLECLEDDDRSMEEKGSCVRSIVDHIDLDPHTHAITVVFRV